VEKRFTPGPWEVGDFRIDGYPIDQPANHYSVAWAYDINGLPANIANAHLIAAAPELYEALSIARDEIDHALNCRARGGLECNCGQRALVEQCDATLAKARGDHA
jgi:hypothetical protein